MIRSRTGVVLAQAGFVSALLVLIAFASYRILLAGPGIICAGRWMSAAEVAAYRDISQNTLELIQRGRGLTLANVCSMPQASLDRAIFRSNSPRPDRPDDAVFFRLRQLRDEQGLIPDDGLTRAAEHIAQMQAASADLANPQLSRADWQWLGPGNIGGRVRALLVHPQNSDILWAGSVSGGIWKSTNGGQSWQALNDFMANLSVSTLVLDPTDPNILYAGTGEGFFNGDALRGAGIFRSTNGGSNWTQLAATSGSNWYYVNRLAMSPDGATLLAATNSGIWRSTDDGTSWQNVFNDFTTGSVWLGNILDIDFSPSSAQKAVASGWHGRAFYSINGGQSWQQATGLPVNQNPSGRALRVELAYAPSNPQIVYASVNSNSGQIYKSTNGGQSYSLVSGTNYNYLGNQGWYDNIIWVDPTNANTLIVGGIDLWRSTNGGVSLSQISIWYASPPSAHADHHVIVADPGFNGTSNRRVFFGNDGGVYKAENVYTVSGTTGWTELNNNLGITQFYGAAGNAGSGMIMGGTQDNGTLRYNGATESWDAVFGGDGGFMAADPSNPNYFYGEYVYLNIHRSSDAGATESVYIAGLYWNEFAQSYFCKPAPYRIDDACNYEANFIAPFILDPNNPERLLAGGRSLWRTNDARTPTTFNSSTGGPSWARIKSPLNVADDEISAIAVARGNSNLIYVGHSNGSIYRTTNGLDANPNWTRIDTANLPNRFVLRLTVHPNNPDIVYASFGGFAPDNLWRSLDGGANWSDLTGSGQTGLPDVPVRSLVINPRETEQLFVGTEAGVFESLDGGQTWLLPQQGPANVSVDELFWMGTRLVAATHGRGLFAAEIAVDLPQKVFVPLTRR